MFNKHLTTNPISCQSSPGLGGQAQNDAGAGGGGVLIDGTGPARSDRGEGYGGGGGGRGDKEGHPGAVIFDFIL